LGSAGDRARRGKKGKGPRNLDREGRGNADVKLKGISVVGKGRGEKHLNESEVEGSDNGVDFGVRSAYEKDHRINPFGKDVSLSGEENPIQDGAARDSAEIGRGVVTVRTLLREGMSLIHKIFKGGFEENKGGGRGDVRDEVPNQETIKTGKKEDECQHEPRPLDITIGFLENHTEGGLLGFPNKSPYLSLAKHRQVSNEGRAWE